MPPKTQREEEIAGIYERLKYQISTNMGLEFDTIADMLVGALSQCLNEADDPDLTNRILNYIEDHI
jgi:hypothetical protein